MLLFKINIFSGKKKPHRESRIARAQIQLDITYQSKEPGIFSRD